MKASYEFAGEWHVAAPVDRVVETVTDLEHYPEWWPQVVAVARIDDDTARVLCRSALPYTLDLVLHAVTREAPVLEVEVAGDLEGWVRWRVAAAERGTAMRFEQTVTVTGALAAASWVGRPLLRWNHDKMMAGCVEGLRARLSLP